jgi:hypothetical protein
MRVTVAVGSMLVLALAAIPLLRDGGDDHTKVAGEPTVTTSAPGRSIAQRYVPAVTSDGAERVMPVTFVDGSGVRLRYPRELDVASLGVVTQGGIDWKSRTTTGADGNPLSCCSSTLFVHYATIAEVYGDAQPVKTFPDADGKPVGFYRGIDAGRTNPVDYLVFQFGPWLVEVHDVQQPGDFELPMTDDELATWARSLRGHVASDGYLRLDPAAPLSLVVGDEPAVIGGPSTYGGSSLGAPFIELFSTKGVCAPTASKADGVQRYPGGAQWCDTEAGVRVSVSGPADFVEQVVAGLEVERA